MPITKDSGAKVFRKRSIMIRAEQYTEYGKRISGMCDSVSCYLLGNTEPHVHPTDRGMIMWLEVGDWILPKGDGYHFYTMKPNTFAATYEEIFDADIE